MMDVEREIMCLFISFQSKGGNHEAFQSNHSSHPSLIKFSAVSTDLRRKEDTGCLVFQYLESLKQYCTWEYGHKCIFFYHFSPDFKMEKVMQILTLKIFLSP